MCIHLKRCIFTYTLPLHKLTSLPPRSPPFPLTLPSLYFLSPTPPSLFVYTQAFHPRIHVTDSDFASMTNNGALCNAKGQLGPAEFERVIRRQVRDWVASGSYCMNRTCRDDSCDAWMRRRAQSRRWWRCCRPSSSSPVVTGPRLRHKFICLVSFALYF